MFSKEDLNITTETVVWTILVLAVTPYILYFVPQLLGADAYIVTSGSMEPGIPEGSVVYEAEPNIQQLGEGDVIVFRPGSQQMTEEIVVHRIVDTQTANYTKQFKTMGDANSNPDPGWTPAYNVIGQKIFSIPYLGTIIQISNTPLFILTVVGIPATILLKTQIENILEEIDKENSNNEPRVIRSG